MSVPASASGTASTARDVGVAIAFVVIWLAFDRLAAAIGSTRGEHGVLVCTVVVGLLLVFERSRGSSSRAALRALGFGPARRGPTLAALAISAALVIFLPAFAAAAGIPIAWHADSALLAAGMWLQGGVAEEALFRGLVFRRFRESRTFWRAALLSAVPFALVHLTLFATLDAAVAAAALALALGVSFPLAWLFERGGGSIWPGALLHGAIQAPIKLIETADAGAFATLSIAWLAVCAALPWLVFASDRAYVPRR